MSTAATTASKGARGGDKSQQLSQLGQSGSRALKNNIATGVMWGAFIIALIPLGWIPRLIPRFQAHTPLTGLSRWQCYHVHGCMRQSG